MLALWQSVLPWDQQCLVLFTLCSVCLHMAGYLISSSLMIKTPNALFPVLYSTMGFQALLAFFGGTTGHAHPRQIIITTLTVIYILRIVGYLIFRSIAIGYKAKPQENPAKMVGVWVAMAMVSTMFTLPIIFTNLPMVTNPDIGALDIAGILVMVVGLVCESIADYQKHIFRSNPKNKHKCCDTGLYKYSRHPNYFGDICVWWGVFLISASVLQAGPRWGWSALLSPLNNMFVLLFAATPRLEREHEHNYGSTLSYQTYRSSTPLLAPYPLWLHGLITSRAGEVEE